MDHNAIVAQRARLAEAITDGELLQVEMGTAMSLDFEPVPWRARIRPLGFVQSAKGERLRCEVRANGLYITAGEAQGDGIKHWPLGSFTILE